MKFCDERIANYYCGGVEFDYFPIDGFWGRKKGRGHKWNFYSNPVTRLMDCMICGKRSTPKKVSCRSDCYGWNRTGPLDMSESKDVLCVGCWRRVASILKKERDFDDNRRMINKLEREISYGRKHQNNGRAA